MKPLTLSCMLISAPLSNSIFIDSTCPASEAIISVVHPHCIDKCISSWEYHQCQIQYNNTVTIHRSTSVHKVNSTQGSTPYTVHQHILLILKRGKVSTVRNIQCSLIFYGLLHDNMFETTVRHSCRHREPQQLCDFTSCIHKGKPHPN